MKENVCNIKFFFSTTVSCAAVFHEIACTVDESCRDTFRKLFSNKLKEFRADQV